MDKLYDNHDKLLEQMDSPIRPIRDGSRPFDDDPSDIAWHIRDKALHNIDAGQAYITEVTLPYLEAEAIEKIRHRTNLAPLVEPDRSKEPDYWRQKWVNEVAHVERHLSAYDPIAVAAIRLLLTAARLRSAIEDKDMEKVAALGILLCCTVFEGGYMLGSEEVRRAFKTTRAENKRLITKTKVTAALGGKGKADKYRPLEEETIRLYSQGSWNTIGAAAVEILPKVIAFGRERGLHVLSVSSKKPFEWISAYKKANQ